MAKIDADKLIDMLDEEGILDKDGGIAFDMRQVLDRLELEELEHKGWRYERNGTLGSVAWGPTMGKGTDENPRISIYFNNFQSKDEGNRQLQRLAKHLNNTRYKP